MKSRATSLAVTALLATWLCVETMPITPELLPRITRGYIQRSKVPVNFDHEMIDYETRHHDNRKSLSLTGAILHETLEELDQLIKKDIADRVDDEIRQGISRDTVFGFPPSGRNIFDFKGHERKNFVQSYGNRFHDEDDYNTDRTDRGGNREFETGDIGVRDTRDMVDNRDIMAAYRDDADFRDSMENGKKLRPDGFIEIGDLKRYDKEKYLSGYRDTGTLNIIEDEFMNANTAKYGMNKKLRQPIENQDAGVDVEKRGRSLWWYRNCNRVRRWRWRDIRAFVRSRRMCGKPAVRVRYGIYG
ncbi:uncharacterized protein LOC135501581 [Lineus longissimus]|uniref:uncharacterized protein LOC135501581 n=1 Tax=Lineus longissimus TaxID=88925 RepID=UPI002B4EC059